MSERNRGLGWRWISACTLAVALAGCSPTDFQRLVELSPTSGAQLPAATVGVNYVTTFYCQGSVNPLYGCDAAVGMAGSLPPGLAFDLYQPDPATDPNPNDPCLNIQACWQIHGTPTQAGTFTFELVAQKANAGVNQVSYIGSYTITVNPVPTAPTITAQPADRTVTAGQTATFSVTATGTSPLAYQWQENGANISGATASTYTTPATTLADTGAQFQVLVSNSAGNLTSSVATLTVHAAASAPVITTASLLAGTVGVAYGPQAIAATGGQTPYTWSWIAATGSTLPPDLTLDPASGAISGTPSAAGTYNVTVSVRDSSSPAQTSAPAPFALTINSAPPPITYQPGPVLAAPSSGPGLLVAVDAGLNVAHGNDGIAVAALAGTTVSAGSAFATVFLRDGAGHWNAQTQLTAPVTATFSSLAISADGNTIVAGSCGQPCTSSGGTAYVYAVNGNAWMPGPLGPSATLSAAPRGLTVGSLGYSVAVDAAGDTIVVGAPNLQTQSVEVGLVAVFVRPAGGWSGAVADTAQLTDGKSQVGQSVAIDASGDTVVAGAAATTQLLTGGALIFLKPTDPNGWAAAGTAGVVSSPSATLAQSSGENPPPIAGDRFGAAVAVSGDGHTVIVGAPSHPDCTPKPCNAHGAGAAYVFVKATDPASWAQMPQPVNESAALTAADGEIGDQLGKAVAVSSDGTTVVAGAPSAPNGSCCSPGPGAIYLFRSAAGSWSQVQEFTATATATAPVVTPESQFGASVAIAGDATAVAAGGYAAVDGTQGLQVVDVFE